MELRLSVGEEELLQFAELNVPDIASSDPEERKCARRLRIKRRLEARKPSTLVMDVEEKQPEKPTLLQIQLDKSSEILRELFLEVEQQVTNIRVANDAREVDSREMEALARQNILEQLDKEAAMAAEMFEIVANKWSSIMKYNDPLNIHDEIKSQKEKCDELVKQKDATITMLRHDVKMAEYKFYKDQKTQNEEVSTLAKRVEKQVAIMRTAHRNQLQDILDVMIQERTNIMENNDKRWEELYKKRGDQELSISQNKFRQKDEFEEVVSTVRIQHYEKIRGMKIRLERDCEILQQEFESIKATALSNREKMDYNYQILRKREDENIIIKSEQKRKLNKLQDIINHLRKKIRVYEETSKNKMDKLFGEIMTFQKGIKGVKTKSETMSRVNESKYMQVWELNRKIATGILNKLLTIDKLLREQQLGLAWEEPTIKPYNLKELRSYMEAAKTIQTSVPPRKSQQISSIEMNFTMAYKRTLNNVLEKVAENSSFLVEERLQNILKDKQKSEVILLKVDNLLSALGVKEQMDCKILMNYFRPYIRCSICSTLKGGPSILSFETLATENTGFIESDDLENDEDDQKLGVREKDMVIDEIVVNMVKPERLQEERPEMIQREGECLGPVPYLMEKEKKEKTVEYKQFGTVIGPTAPMNCWNNHEMVIDGAYVLKAIREFITNSYRGEDVIPNIPEAATRTLTISRLMTEEDVKNYWERFMNILDSNSVQLWDALYYGLQKYHEILEDRNKIHEKLKCLRRQNKELRHLLGKYKIDQNMPPPCAEQREMPVIHKITDLVCKKE